MPIANCIVAAHCQLPIDDLVTRWAEESGMSAEHMTVNLVTSKQQIGVHYAVMATLLVPSMWSESAIDSLQLGLARALSKCLSLSLQEVHVTSHIIQSGNVIENGQKLEW